MSAAPLPPVQAATPSSPPASASASRNNAQESSAAFDTHLQDAQRQQTSSDEAQQASERQTDQRQQANSQNSKASANAGQSTTPTTGANQPAATTPAQSAADASQASSSGSTIDVVPSVASLASAVLSLIGQAAGDSDNESTAAATTTTASPKTAAPKTLAPTNSPAQPAPAGNAIAPMPLPPPIAQLASAAKTGGAGGMNVDAVQAGASGTTTGTASSAAGSENGSATNTSASAGANSGVNDAGASAANGASTGSDGGAAFQAAVDSVQMSASILQGGEHTASSAIGAAAAPAAQTQNTPDIASIRGALDATAVATPTNTSTTTGHSLANNAPVGSSGFAKELGQQVTWLSGQEVKQAQIRLNPESLGPLDVKVNVEHGRVDVAFMTQHPAATAAVQQGLDHLSQMLSGQGLSLGQATVGQQSQQQQFEGQSQASNGKASTNTSDADDTVAATVQRVAIGLVDAFA